MKSLLSLLPVVLSLLIQTAAAENATAIETGRPAECGRRYLREANAENVVIYFIGNETARPFDGRPVMTLPSFSSSPTATTFKNNSPAPQDISSTQPRAVTRLTPPHLMVAKDKKTVNLLGRSVLPSTTTRRQKQKTSAFSKVSELFR